MLKDFQKYKNFNLNKNSNNMADAYAYYPSPKDISAANLKLKIQALFDAAGLNFSLEGLQKIIKKYENLNDLVENLDSVPTQYKEGAKLATAKIWRNKTGINYLQNAGISPIYINKNGSIEDYYLDKIMNMPVSKNKTSFIFEELNKSFLNTPKKIEKIRFEATRNNVNLKNPIIKMKIITSFDFNNKKHLGLTEININPQQTALRAYFSLIVNGKANGLHNLIRLDCNGYIDKDFIIKSNQEHLFKYISDKELDSFNSVFSHKNFYASSSEPEYKAEFGIASNGYSHVHQVDGSFEMAKALIFLNGILNSDTQSLQYLKKVDSKMNAKNVEFYEDEKLKLKDLKEYNAMLPVSHFIKYFFEKIKLDHSNLKELDTLFTAFDNYRKQENSNQTFYLDYFNKLFDLNKENEKKADSIN